MGRGGLGGAKKVAGMGKNVLPEGTRKARSGEGRACRGGEARYFLRKARTSSAW